MSDYTILVVDDEVSVLNAVYRVFRKEGYQILRSDNPADALKLLNEHVCHIIISDYRMPEMDGVTFLREAMNIRPDAIRMILSGYADSSTIISAINDGGIYKFLTKPWEDDILKSEVRYAIERYELQSVNKKLLEDVKRQNEELKKTNMLLTEKIDEIQENVVSTVEMLCYLSREKYSGLPTNVDSLYTIGQEVGRKLGFNDSGLKNLYIATKLHDIGNIGIDCGIFKKSGPLTHEERIQVEKHPIIGASILSFLNGFDEVSRIVKYHHEYFDGTGYPEGLKGDAIPAGSRIVHIIDVYDSLTCIRPYRPAMVRDEVYRMLEKGRGTEFDPYILDIFLMAIERHYES